MIIADLPTKRILALSQWQTFPRVFTYKMAAKFDWHRCGTKFRHCQPVYRFFYSSAINGSFTAHELNWTGLDSSSRVYSNVNGRFGVHVLRTNWALTALVSLQPISAKYSRDADARDQWTRRVTGSTCWVQFVCCRRALRVGRGDERKRYFGSRSRQIS